MLKSFSLSAFLRRVLFFAHRNRLRQEMEEEMRLHIKQRVLRGISPEAARHRFGNRTALEEQAREAWIPQIAFLILNHALRWTAAGIAVGLLGALIATRFLRSLLFNVSPENPLLFSVAALILLAVAVAATLLPALRASRIDPMVVLRQE